MKKENEIDSFSQIELFSQSNPNYILNDTENVYICRRPHDKMICYAHNDTLFPWPIREEIVWPLTVKDLHIPEPPKDVWFLIFKYVTVGDLLSMAQVNRTLYDLARRDGAWENLKLELLSCVPAAKWFFNKHKADSHPIWKAFIHMKNCGTPDKRKFERLDGKSWGVVFCLGLNMLLPFGFEEQFGRIKKPTEAESPR
jgi:F-box-like